MYDCFREGGGVLRAAVTARCGMPGAARGASPAGRARRRPCRVALGRGRGLALAGRSAARKRQGDRGYERLALWFLFGPLPIIQ